MFVGVDAHIDPLGNCEFAGDSRKNRCIVGADVGIGPYNAHAKAARSASSLRKLQPVHHAGLCAGGDVRADDLTVLD